VPDRRKYELCVLSELRDRLRADHVGVEGRVTTPVIRNQAYRASGLNLLLATVILWNTRIC
jgi:TnpA family transposase